MVSNSDPLRTPYSGPLFQYRSSILLRHDPSFVILKFVFSINFFVLNLKIFIRVFSYVTKVRYHLLFVLVVLDSLITPDIPEPWFIDEETGTADNVSSPQD